MRNEAAAIQFGQDAVEADFVLQPAQPRGDAVRSSDDDVAAEHVGVGQSAQTFGPVDEGLPAGASRRIGNQLVLQAIEVRDALLGLGAAVAARIMRESPERSGAGRGRSRTIMSRHYSARQAFDEPDRLQGVDVRLAVCQPADRI